MRAPLLLAWSLACGGASDPAPARAYVEAAAQGSPEACAAVSDPELRGECLVFTLDAQVEAGGLDAGRALCTQVPAGLWADECWFQLSDAVRATGELAKDLCGRSERFSAQCLGHVVARDSQSVLAELPPGQEAEALERLRELSVDYLGQRLGTAKARQNMRKALAARFRDQPFDPEGCGNVGPTVCREVYRELVTFAAAHEQGEANRVGDTAIRRICLDGPTLEGVRAARLPEWTPAGEPLALAAWEELCHKQQLLAPRVRGKGPRPGPEAKP